ncbi:MAG: hypothetical protein FWE82_08200 [Defluviitaleaceae bacterium]|nr:hypothetical protein [Defluviitaleaceae bacterium]
MGRQKIIYISFLVFIFAVLVIFTNFGKELYGIGKPAVTITRARFPNDADFFIAPASALQTDGEIIYLFFVKAESGYSRQILTAHRFEVILLGTDFEGLARLKKISPDKLPGDTVITSADKEIKDGERVVLK